MKFSHRGAREPPVAHQLKEKSTSATVKLRTIKKSSMTITCTFHSRIQFIILISAKNWKCWKSFTWRHGT